MYRKSYTFMALVLIMLMLLSACFTGANQGGSILPDDAAMGDAQQKDAAEPEDTLPPEDTPQPEPDDDPEDLDGGDIVLVPDSPAESPEPEDTPDPKDTAKPTSSPAPTKKPSEKYMLEVDVTNQVVTAYGQDSEGNYTKIVRQMICSTGKASTPTPLGTYKMPGGDYTRVRWGYFTKYNTWAQYWSRIYKGYLFHSYLYSDKDETAVRQSTVDALGS
ncbi:MAG TPA: L,D-transpeptidase, partial [Clostridiales bacterium]|nr:L,D-transpeptidase [Clostridiales bacterium]